MHLCENDNNSAIRSNFAVPAWQENNVQSYINLMNEIGPQVQILMTTHLNKMYQINRMTLHCISIRSSRIQFKWQFVQH